MVCFDFILRDFIWLLADDEGVAVRLSVVIVVGVV